MEATKDKQPQQQQHNYLLDDQWTFYHSLRGRKAKFSANQYDSNLNPLGNISTMQDFFNFYCYLMRPSQWPIDNKIILFRKDLKPLWETLYQLIQKDWKEGGCWILMYKHKESQIMNKHWELLQFACIGEQFPSKQVLGIVISVRIKHSLIEVWIRDKEEQKKLSIGEKLREILNFDPENIKLYYKDNDISLKVYFQKNQTFFYKNKSIMQGSESYAFVSTPFEFPMRSPPQQKKEDKDDLEQFELV